MRASKLLATLSFTASVLSLPTEGFPDGVDNPAVDGHGPNFNQLFGGPSWPVDEHYPVAQRDEATPAVENIVQPPRSEGLPQHPPRNEMPCTPLDPRCWNVDKRDTDTGLTLANDWTNYDWTDWVCTLDPEWACSYADLDNPDGSHDEGDLTVTPAITKRDLPTELGEIQTYHQSAQGQDQSVELQLMNMNPRVYGATFWAHATSYTVIASQINDHRNVVLQRIFMDGYSTEMTRTMYADPTSIATMTSVSFAKRQTLAVPTPTAPHSDAKTRRDNAAAQTTQRGSASKRDSPKDDAFSSDKAEIASLELEYALAASASPSDYAQLNRLRMEIADGVIALAEKYPSSLHRQLSSMLISARDADGIDAAPAVDHSSTSKRDSPNDKAFSSDAAEISNMEIEYAAVAATASPSDASRLKELYWKIQLSADAFGHKYPSSVLQETFSRSILPRDVDEIDTMTIVDEHPGHTTLNPEVATQTSHQTTDVTVVNHDGTKYTLSATTDSDGRTIMVTEGHEAMTKSLDAYTVTLVADEDDITTIEPSKTARVLKLWSSTIEAPIPKVAIPTSSSTIEAPIPKVALPSSPAEAPASGSVVTKVVTETVTKYKQPNDHHATLVPMRWDPKDVDGYSHIMQMTMHELKMHHPGADWNGQIPSTAQQFRDHDPGMTNEDSLKYAFIVLHKHPEHHRHYPPLSSGEHLVTQYMFKSNGHTVPVTAPTQTIGGRRFVIDPLMKYKRFDPLTHNVAPTGSCHDDDANRFEEVHHYDKDECAVEKCMWNYMKPINITTVMPAVLFDDRRGDMVYDYFTHDTHIHNAHWGTKEPHGLYYPTKTTIRYTNGTAHNIVVRATPSHMHEHEKERRGVHGDPHCWDIKTCHSRCKLHDDDSWDWDPKIFMYIALGLLAVALPLLLLVLIKRHRRNKDQPNKSSINDKLRRKSTEKPQAVVVDQATGQVTDPAGHPVDPETAAAATTATGAPAASDRNGNQGEQPPTSNDDGRSTTGRRAEEGRSRVNFADQGKPEAEPKSASEPTPAGEPAPSSTIAQPSEHAEPVPVPDKDGATEGVVTGRHQAEPGSVRGRKSNRPEGIAGLGF